MDWKRELGADIERARRKKGWTQEELGEKAILHKNTIGFYERGERAPKFDDLRRLAETLGRNHFDIGEKMRIEFRVNGTPHPEPPGQQLEFQFDVKNGVNVRIESSGTGLVIRKLSA